VAKEKRGCRRVLVLFLVTLMLAGLAGVAYYVNIVSFGKQPLASDAPREVIVEPGDGFNTVLAKLRQAGVTEGSDWQWRSLGWVTGTSSRIQVGEYEISPKATPRSLLWRMAHGDVVQRRFTVIPGRNFRELRALLQADQQLDDEIARMSDAEVMAALGRPKVSPEGRFLPETYAYTRGTTDLQILARAMKAMDKQLEAVWRKRDPGLPLKNPDQLLTLASIVEKETGLASERPQIAGVFVRRLRKGMLLQTDPTVIYGIGPGYDGNIRKADLERDTPWNTYTRAGLPPTPIAMPGKAALEAAAHPSGGSSLYFVASGGGGHVFNDTLDAHNAAVRKYQLKR
jgi:UPF0755 protein